MKYNVHFLGSILLSLTLGGCGQIFGPLHSSGDETDQGHSADEHATLVWQKAENVPAEPHLSDVEQSEKDLAEHEPSSTEYGPEWEHYLQLSETHNTEVQRHNEIMDELEQNGEVTLPPGSYKFSLESFCMDLSKHSPNSHDGMSITQNFPEDREWLPIFLLNYKKVGIPQPDAQNMLWSLRDNHSFSLLTKDQQDKLLKIFPDAATRFPNQASAPSSQLTKNRLSGLAARKPMMLLEGESSTVVPWLRAPNGMLVRPVAHGYSEMVFDVVVPANSPPLTFNPLNYVGKANQDGEEKQKIAVSPNARERKVPKEVKQPPRDKNAHVCPEDMEHIGAKLLDLGSPDKFRDYGYYQIKSGVPVPEKTFDCSRFVHEIYGQAGMKYNYETTRTIGSNIHFEEVIESEAKPGDVVVIANQTTTVPYHMGIYAGDKGILQSGLGRKDHKDTSRVENRESEDFTSTVRYRTEAAFSGTKKYYRWKSCN